MHYWIETYGCQMNKAETEALRLSLKASGFEEATGPEEANLVILNTCAVRKTAEERIWGRLGFYRALKQKQSFKLILTGCLGEKLKENLQADYPEIDLVLGSAQKLKLISYLGCSQQELGVAIRDEQDEYNFAPLHSSSGFKAFVPIMHGCNNFCSYCIVPYVRGKEISRSPKDILAELHELEKRQVREVTLLGQNVNSYCFQDNGQKITFADLLAIIEKEVDQIRWVRFLTSHPKDVSPQLIERLADSRRLCHHLHLPVQHASNRILKLMNRGYTREEYLNLVERLKNKVSGITLTTDILVGFPGEREDDLQQVLTLMEEVGYTDAFTYYYNPREGTKAYAFADNVPLELKLERLRLVIAKMQQIKLKLKKERLGREVVVLAEGFSKKDSSELLGRTEHDEMVVFKGPPTLVGQFIKVRLVGLNGTTFKATASY